MPKVKLSQDQFDKFILHCLRYQQHFQLNNWELHFRWKDKPDEEAATIYCNLSGYIATLYLNPEWDNYSAVTDDDIKRVAKHEMLHLLMARIDCTAKSRFVSENEYQEAAEEVVRKIEHILDIRG